MCVCMYVHRQNATQDTANILQLLLFSQCSEGKLKAWPVKNKKPGGWSLLKQTERNYIANFSGLLCETPFSTTAFEQPLWFCFALNKAHTACCFLIFSKHKRHPLGSDAVILSMLNSSGKYMTGILIWSSNSFSSRVFCLSRQQKHSWSSQQCLFVESYTEGEDSQVSF